MVTSPHIVHCNHITVQQNLYWGVVWVFVFSVKTSKRQILSLLLCVVMLIAILVVVIVWPAKDASAEVFQPVSAADDAQRLAFLRSLGYEASADSGQVREVLIPDEFDDVFSQYNAVQKTADMDLEPYRGRRMKCWTYEITNYPGEEHVQAHLYVYKDQIIGGDIASTALDGFMHGLVKIPASLPSAVSSNSQPAQTAGAAGTTDAPTTTGTKSAQ